MHPQRPGVEGFWSGPKDSLSTPGPWYHPGLAPWTWGLNTAYSSKGGKYLLTEFLVNDLWGIMAGGKDAVRSGKARVSLISTKEKGGSSKQHTSTYITCSPQQDSRKMACECLEKN